MQNLLKDGRAQLWMCAITAACLALPIALPPVFRYETTPAFLLAPVVAWAVIALLNEAATRSFVVAGICGLISIFVSAWIKPDGRLQLDLLSLLLLMFAAGFYFLGRYLGDTKRFVTYFVVFSAVFLVPATLRNLLGADIQGRIAEPNGIDFFAFLNVEWFGWLMFGYFGILGAAHMLCLQATLALGVALATNRKWLLAVSAIVFACTAYLIVGSQSRGALVALVMALVGAGFYAFTLERKLWRRAAAMIAIALVAGTFSQIQSSEENRWAQTFREVATLMERKAPPPAPAPSEPQAPVAPAPEPAPAPTATTEIQAPPKEQEPTPKTSNHKEEKPLTLDRISSRRFSLQIVAINEFLASPIIGSGFSPLGRYEPPPTDIIHTTPHLYYLTALWKGGLLFAVPFFTFLFLAARGAWRARIWRQGPEEFMALVAVLALAGPMAFTAETPNVPSAGALGFLLLGSLTMGPNTTHQSIRDP